MKTLDFYRTARTSVVAKELDLNEFLEACKSPVVADLIHRYRNGEALAKKKLPAVTFMGKSLTRHRRSSDCVPTGLVMLDIDHADENLPQLIQLTESEQFRSTVKPVLIHITPSGKGLRIVYPMPHRCRW